MIGKVPSAAWSRCSAPQARRQRPHDLRRGWRGARAEIIRTAAQSPAGAAARRQPLRQPATRSTSALAAPVGQDTLAYQSELLKPPRAALMKDGPHGSR